MKRIMLLGASGSIGIQTLDVIVHHPEQFHLVGCSVGYNIEQLHHILQRWELEIICVVEQNVAVTLQSQYPKCKVVYGEAGLQRLAEYEAYDILVNAVVGFRGLVPTLTAIEHRKDVALANKESLVAGGPLVKQALAKYQVHLYPIDSEHSAIFQCLQGNDHGEVSTLIVTASGGSFRDKTREELHNVSVAQALHHPNWSMGGRITIDSATMMNKGFEVIEAHYLFDIAFDQIQVVIQRESVIHSMVQYCDHAVIAQLGTADMRLPIQYALTYPNRLPMEHVQPLNLLDFPALHFEQADMKRYPLLALAYEVGKKGGNLGAVMNGADEMAVALFLEEKISFLDIEVSIQKAVAQATFIQDPSLYDLIQSDAEARAFVKNFWEE